jgi:hypothetical protein
LAGTSTNPKDNSPVSAAALLNRPTIEAVQFVNDPQPDYVGVHPDFPWMEQPEVFEAQVPAFLGALGVKAN